MSQPKNTDIFFLCLLENIYYGYSLEVPYKGQIYDSMEKQDSHFYMDIPLI